MNARPSPAMPELADVVQLHGHRLPLTGEQRRILSDIAACRTAILGGHVEQCDCCQHQRIAYNSCRNRHCPKCQASACAKWMTKRADELLPVEYFHVVFTLPDILNSLALANRRAVYDTLFDAVGQTLLEIAADPKYLGARTGFIGVLHTWGQNLSLHPHVHCIVPGGGISTDNRHWIRCKPGFFLPVKVLSRVFRGKFIDLLRRRHARHPITNITAESLEKVFDESVRSQWVVYAKPPFGGPAQVLKYLSRYTHRIAITNRRIISVDHQHVTFRWKDYRQQDSHQKQMTLDGAEFLRRFLLHAIPRGFMRIRHFGILANRVRQRNLHISRTLLTENATHFTVESPRIPITASPCCPVCGQGNLIRCQPIRPAKRDPLIVEIDSS